MVAAVVAAVVCALAPATAAVASPILLSGSGAWNSWSTAQIGSGPFWANRSYDRNGLSNVGFYLAAIPGSDVPGFSEFSPGGTFAYLGEGSTTFALQLTEPRAPTDFMHLLSVTGWNDGFGLFNLATGEKYPFFRAWETRGQTTPFSGVGTYGFYISTGEGYTWYSTTLDGGRSHFALFQGPGEWYLGVEDATWTTRRPADWDYNDIVIKWSTRPMLMQVAEPVPEVGSLGMMGLGLLSLGAAIRRWRR
jgi:hypothetical protein